MSHLNKASAFAAIIVLVAVSTVSTSAQTTAAANSLMTSGPSADSVRVARETKETPLDKKSAADVTVGPKEEAPAVNPRAEVSNSLPTKTGTREAGPLVSPASVASLESTAPTTTTPPQTTTVDDDAWQFQITPYVFIPTISGRVGIGNLVADTQVSVGESDVELNFAFMGTFEARKGRFIILSDFLYADIATERANPGPLFSSSRLSFKAIVFDPEVGYRFLDNGEGSSLDVVGGIRYWHLNATLNFAAGVLPAVQASRSRSWVDGVVGLRGKAHLSPRWFVAGKADLGAGGSEFTYQLFGAVGVNFGKRVALIGGYRSLNVNYDKNNFLFDMNLHGPIIGLGFKL